MHSHRDSFAFALQNRKSLYYGEHLDFLAQVFLNYKDLWIIV